MFGDVMTRAVHGVGNPYGLGMVLWIWRGFRVDIDIFLVKSFEAGWVMDSRKDSEKIVLYCFPARTNPAATDDSWHQLTIPED